MTIRSGYRLSVVLDSARKTVVKRWGGIKCRVACYMALALILAASIIIVTFAWNARSVQEHDLISRAIAISDSLATITAGDELSINRSELHRKASALHSQIVTDPQDYNLLLLEIYDRNGAVLFPAPQFALDASTVQNDSQSAAGQPSLRATISKPRFQWGKYVILDIVVPLKVKDPRGGLVRIKLAQKRNWLTAGIGPFQGVALVGGLVLIGMLFSQLINDGITRSLSRLSIAVEQLSKQKWKAPIPVQGTDEFGRLAGAFNAMANVLNERELSLSRGNRDLFILHTASLDLMESLELELLSKKISARSADLVRADTTMISTLDKMTRQLRYMGGEGSKVRMLNTQEIPIEAGGIFNWFACYSTPLLIPDAQTDFRLNGDQMRSLGINSILAVPLWASNTMVGILTAINKKGGDSFDKQDLRLLTIFSNLAGAALQNAFLYDDLKQKIAELGTAQQQLVQSTKMAAVGELAANIAHEINNPLTSVLGYTSHLLKSLVIPDDSREKLRLMEQETLRVRKIIRNLLDFSHSRPPVMQAGDLLRPLRETVAFMRGVADRQNVTISENYPQDPVFVLMDHNELKQVFINIINNAFHAMSGGGELSIAVDRKGADQASVTISDTGEGIAADHMEKIFEPFFSTKRRGDGTGLGLSISSRIISNHGGRIEVESMPGQGARFTLYLPAADMNLLEVQPKEATRDAC